MSIHTQDERWQADRYSLDVELRNVSDVISIVQTAEGAMAEASNILYRMLDLAKMSSRGPPSDRISIQEEITALNSELNRIAETTSFAGKTLLDGSFGKQSFRIGESSGETVVLTLGNIRSDSVEMGGKAYVAQNAASPDWVVTTNTDLSLNYTAKLGGAKSITLQAQQGDRLQDVAAYVSGQSDDVKAFVGEDGKLQIFASTQKVDGEITIGGNLGTELDFGAAKDVTVADIDVTTGGNQQALAFLDGALKAVHSQRAALGALQNRLSHLINNLSSIDAARGRISDADFAEKTAALTKSQILAQASASILAQAKETPSSVLSLLQ